jgi:hypothetical protein
MPKRETETDAMAGIGFNARLALLRPMLPEGQLAMESSVRFIEAGLIEANR